MGKMLKKNYLRRGGANRPILAVSLAAALAAFGCTTNVNPGNGTPTRTGPELRSAPSSVPLGSESATPPPMMSSYTRAEALPAPTARLVRRSASEAAAIMAGRGALRARYLGPVNPGNTSRTHVSDLNPGNQIDLPALRTNPQLTVNSSISSPPTPVVSSGAGGVATGGAVLVNGATTGAVVLPGTAGVPATAGVGATSGAVPTPTAAALGLPAGTFAASTLSPTAAAVLNPTVTAASGPGLVTTAGATTVGTTATTVGTTANATTAARTTVGTASAGVRIVRSSSGAVTVTNQR